MDFVDPDCLTDAFWLNPREDIVLMQYTGLKDKNGREIYEGDIVLESHLHHINVRAKEAPVFEKFVGAVRYDAPMFTCGAIEGDWHTVHFMNFLNSEIIGNIYENPELIKVHS